jgi:AcrR family transcriptional regulator
VSDQAVAKAPSRDRRATEQRLRDAVGALLARQGFGALGVRAVAREAGVDPMLVGRYFGGLAGLFQSYAESEAFWPVATEITEDGAFAHLPLAARLSRVLANFAEALARRPVACEILAWEAAQRSELTDALDRARLAGVNAVIAQCLPELAEPGETAAEANALFTLLGAAVHYIAIRNRNPDQDWGGLGVRNADGRARLNAIVSRTCEAVLA